MTYRPLSRDGTADPPPVTAMAANPLEPEVRAAAYAAPRLIPKVPSPQARHHSNSMPTTPSHQQHLNTSQKRSPSLGRTLNNGSPHSIRSDSSQTPPATRKVHVGCKYETGMAKARRRVPYSLGPDKLGPDPARSRKRLSSEEEEKLSKDMQELYNRLLPSEDSEKRRALLVEKLERLLRDRWPGTSIKVNVFGSTGNSLGTSDSDVDICITTDNKELSRVCSIAELLAANGMQRVVCVSSAKVPIVKVWDPELQVACDLNVNNPIALENTALIKSYIEIDHRVRPLAMIIKYWAKRRILNDAALGGTLSSYTWICLTLNFLQTRDPPIIPSLQQQPHLKPRLLDGVNVAFDKNLDKYKDFGAANTSSLGELFYQFLRFYAFELDFEEKVMSVRLGSLMPKSDKGWHLLQDNRLCVEEPFNISRNLANTADDTSMRGIHLELRRAFALVADGHLEKSCEQYSYPPDEPKSSEHFVPPIARPVIPQPPHPPRGGKFGGRGGRKAAHLNGVNIAGRRLSNPASRTQAPMMLRNLPFQMTTQELQLQAQHQQHLLHDQLYQQFQYLQLQEQELRARLNQQRQRSMLSQTTYAGHPLGQYSSQDENTEGGHAGAFHPSSQAPLSAPLYQHRFVSSPFLHPSLPVTGVATNPSSPHLSPAMPDSRRFSRRTSITQSSLGGSLRAQSQPARTLATPLGFGQFQTGVDLHEYLTGRRSSASSTSHETQGGYSNVGINGIGSAHETSRRPAEYVGYYVGQSPSLLGYPQSASISPIPSHAGLAIQNGGLSPRLSTTSPPPSVNDFNLSIGAESAHGSRIGGNAGKTEKSSRPDDDNAPSPKRGPLIVNGSISSPRRRQPADPTRLEGDDHLTFSASTSEDLAFDTPSSSDEQSQDPREMDRATDNKGGAEPKEQTHAKSMNGHAGRIEQINGLANGGEIRQASHVVTDAPVTPALLPWSLGRQLSAVQEVRTPSPGLDALYGSPASPTSTIRQHGNSRVKKDETKRDSLDAGTLSPRPNGVPVTGAGAETGVTTTQSSWQTQKKKKNKKKTVKSENDAQAMNESGGDYMPIDESQRKGG